jgi:hypothetical protein
MFHPAASASASPPAAAARGRRAGPLVPAASTVRERYRRLEIRLLEAEYRRLEIRLLEAENPRQEA